MQSLEASSTVPRNRKNGLGRYRFDRMELAGSLGDLGTLLPLAIGMVLVNGIHAEGTFFSIGLFYLLSGVYFRTTVPVQPMKVVSAYAIATGMAAGQILASGLLIGLFLLLIGATGAITWIGRYTPKSVVRGVQLSTGALLMSQGIKFMAGTSSFQLLKHAAEPYLTVQSLGPVPLGIVIGLAGGIGTLFFLENKKFPAGLLVVLGGILVGLLLGTWEGIDRLRIGISLPTLLPFEFPSLTDFSAAFLLLVLPQIPMTLGNAVIAYVDLSDTYFGEKAERVTYRSACISMALANFGSFLLGGMPLCHGAGGLAAHYRFGARTAGSNLMIGGIFVMLAVLFGVHAISLLYLMPMAILGVLLVFAGAQLGLTILDLKDRKELFVVLLILGITLASNLAFGFLIGIAAAYALKSEKLKI